MLYVFRLDELSFSIGENLPTSNLWEAFRRRDYSLVREACQLILRIRFNKFFIQQKTVRLGKVFILLFWRF